MGSSFIGREGGKGRERESTLEREMEAGSHARDACRSHLLATEHVCVCVCVCVFTQDPENRECSIYPS